MAVVVSATEASLDKNNEVVCEMAEPVKSTDVPTRAETKVGSDRDCLSQLRMLDMFVFHNMGVMVGMHNVALTFAYSEPF